ncbi:hypothetical protein N7470_000712 [Penicillium chermesinum]|nr:hypothetical protein N7470_000712 [Penicillium chermesinum]
MGSHHPSCPFCPFFDEDAGFVAQHIDYCHPEEGVPAESSREPEDDSIQYVDCPHGCGETVGLSELSTHLDLHTAESIPADGNGWSQDSNPTFGDHELSSDSNEPMGHASGRKGGKMAADRGLLQSNPSKRSRTRSPAATIESGPAKRLGRSELGPHAHEKKMPSWLKKMLEKGGQTTKQTQITADGRLTRHTKVENETDNLVPVLGRLCEQDKSVQRAFLCSPKVQHVCKMPREGGFCGYRNIQMMISYIKKSQSPGHEHFPRGIPTILELQERIEEAWDRGFNSRGRVETGGIRGTRKFIGTPEAQALFMSLDIRCEASSFGQKEGIRAYESLYDHIAAYFRAGCSIEDEDSKVSKTDLPPVYFQHQGFEIRSDGSANLLVFDPMFKTSPAMHRLIGTSARSENPARLLKAYRRGASYLQKHRVFEIIKWVLPW